MCIFTYQGALVPEAVLAANGAAPAVTGANGCFEADGIPFGNYTGTASKNEVSSPFSIDFKYDGQVIYLNY